MNRNLTAMIGCGALLVATGTYAGDNDHLLDSSCYKINLRNAATLHLSRSSHLWFCLKIPMVMDGLKRSSK